MAHIRHSRPDSGLVFHVKPLKTFQGVSSSLGSGVSRCQVEGESSPIQLRDASKMSRVQGAGCIVEGYVSGLRIVDLRVEDFGVEGLMVELRFEG